MHGEIEFRDVSVDYANGSVLARIDLRIHEGATLAVVGHTGSGKTTLVSLVPRLMDPTYGRILLDGADLRELDPAAVRRQIGFVPQETFLFSATVSENIAFGVEGATAAEIRSAAEIARGAVDEDGLARLKPAGEETAVRHEQRPQKAPSRRVVGLDVADRKDILGRRAQPFGSEAWTAGLIARVGLEHTVRPQGRPRKAASGA